MTQNNDEFDIDMEDNTESNVSDDVVFDDVDEEGKSLESVKSVRAKLKKCEDEKKEFLDGWQRCKADAVNIRKRDEELRVSAVQATREDTLFSLLPVLDSFEMAFNNSDAHKDIDPNWVAGMQHIQNQLIGIFADHGITLIDPTGEMFDPTRHESVEVRSVETSDEDNKVLQVIQKGYIIGDRVLRAAKVVVGEHK